MSFSHLNNSWGHSRFHDTMAADYRSVKRAAKSKETRNSWIFPQRLDKELSRLAESGGASLIHNIM